jgi:hypothetical protein
MVVVFCAAPVGAQRGNSDRCEVISVDVTGRKLSQWDKLQGRRLGTFDTTIAEEELTTKIYRLPKTKLFVVASVGTPTSQWHRNAGPTRFLCNYLSLQKANVTSETLWYTPTQKCR